MDIKIPTAEKMNKFPWATSVVSLFAVIVFLIYLLLTKPDCEECEKRYEAERTKNDVLTTALLIKNGIILQQIDIASKKDSVTNEKLNKSKEIVIKNK